MPTLRPSLSLSASRIKQSKLRDQSPENKIPMDQETLERILPIYINLDPLPSNVRVDRFICKIHLPDDKMTKKVFCDGEKSAIEFIGDLVERFNRIHRFNRKRDEYILKSTGVVEYIFGSHKIKNFEYIRSCLKHSKQVELYMLEIASIEVDVDAMVCQ